MYESEGAARREVLRCGRRETTGHVIAEKATE